MKTIGMLAVLGLLAFASSAQAASIITVYNKGSDSSVTTLPNGATATTQYQRNGNTVTATTTFQRSGAGNYQPTGAGGYRPMGNGSGSSYNPMGSR